MCVWCDVKDYVVKGDPGLRGFSRRRSKASYGKERKGEEGRGEERREERSGT
jgi:hypothetical protein